ncbi:hypothetical protein [Streptomyces sp. Cmuel-A718b]|uniref:hypothetical protein n=1 Tax=Streptomyces sp. Cmuel-A718b TaxID=697328 RepID=UPI00081D98DF|nr:hypothetical protein [Streptomyces sp. Cmuel-A718b]SCF58501.1 hypothetical protein GA0115280_10263 [Streptomyces sp. Cmuel-A718b]
MRGKPTAGPGKPLYRGMDRAALDLQYSPSSRVPSLQAYLDAYERLSARAHQNHPVRTALRYGPHPAELLDYFPAAGVAGRRCWCSSTAGTGRPWAGQHRLSRHRRYWPRGRLSP